MNIEDINEMILFEARSVNNSVIHYTNRLIDIIEKEGLKSFSKKITLKSNNDMKLKMDLIVDVNSEKYTNHGYFKCDENEIIDDEGYLNNCNLFIELELTNSEKKKGFISYKNKVRYLINHELHHAMEIYNYKFNNKAFSKSWIISKFNLKHDTFASKYKYWDTFNYLIYLSLDHEVNARVSSIYEIMLKNENLDSIKNEKIYKDGVFMSKFDSIIFIDQLRQKYDNKNLMIIFKKFCEDYELTFLNDDKYFEDVVKKIIKNINKKGRKILKKIENVIKRIERERSDDEYTTECFHNRIINYDEYLKRL